MEQITEGLTYADRFGIILNVATVPGTGPPEVDVTLFTLNRFPTASILCTMTLGLDNHHTLDSSLMSSPRISARGVH